MVVGGVVVAGAVVVVAGAVVVVAGAVVVETGAVVVVAAGAVVVVAGTVVAGTVVLGSIVVVAANAVVVVAGTVVVGAASVVEGGSVVVSCALGSVSKRSRRRSASSRSAVPKRRSMSSTVSAFQGLCHSVA